MTTNTTTRAAIWRQVRDTLDAATETEHRRDLSDAEHSANCLAADRAFQRLIDSPAPDLASAAEKLQRVIERVHLDEIGLLRLDDPRARALGLRDPMNDGPRPLIRIHDDLKRLASAEASESDDRLRSLAAGVASHLTAERELLDVLDRADEKGADTDDHWSYAALDALDDRLEAAAREATDIRATTRSDLAHKGLIAHVLHNVSRRPDFEWEDWEMALLASFARDAAEAGGLA